MDITKILTKGIKLYLSLYYLSALNIFFLVTDSQVIKTTVFSRTNFGAKVEQICQSCANVCHFIVFEDLSLQNFQKRHLTFRQTSNVRVKKKFKPQSIKEELLQIAFLHLLSRPPKECLHDSPSPFFFPPMQKKRKRQKQSRSHIFTEKSTVFYSLQLNHIY